MTACYYLASKIDEFYVPINEFVLNLQSVLLYLTSI